MTYNASLVSLLGHYGSAPKACKPYRAKTKGKVERSFRTRHWARTNGAFNGSFRQDFFLGRMFRDLEDLNVQFDEWCSEIANARVHATTERIVAEHFTEEQPSLIPLPAMRYSAVLTIERRVTRDGMISVAGNHYSVPDSTRRRTVEAQVHPTEVRIFEGEGRSAPRVRAPPRTD